MKTIECKPETGRWYCAHLGGEGGFLLVMVMVVMLALSAVAASMLINSFLERSLAKNQNYSSVALQAAEAGLAAGSTWLRENQAAIPAAPPWSDISGVWPQTLTGTVFTDSDGRSARYTVTMRYKREWRDVNGDGDCTDPGESSGYQDNDGSPATDCPGDIVIYNRCSGAANCFDFPESPFAGPPSVQNYGFPVAEIDSVGTFGESSYRQVALDVARNRLRAIGVHGGITAKGNVALMGTADVDGTNFNLAGTAPDTTCANMPGAYVETGMAATNNSPQGVYAGDPPIVVNPAAGAGRKTLYTTPWEALEIEETDMPAPVDAATATAMLLNPAKQGEIVYFNPSPTGTVAERTYTPPDNSRGLLVVHNAAGNAVMKIDGTMQFTGLIIADVVEIHGTSDIIGAVISLSSVTVDVSAGTPRIQYSCAAINMATRQAYTNKLGWHRLR
jgi:Tfp pilus assembly protein PilX